MRRLVALVAGLILLAVPAASARSVPTGTLDPLSGLQWGHEQLRLAEAWGSATGVGQTIAIIDSGVDLDHPDLAGQIAGGATFVGCADAPDGCGDGDIDSGERRAGDGHPHGTHVAGIVAAEAGNGEGIAGVAPERARARSRRSPPACAGRRTTAPTSST